MKQFDDEVQRLLRAAGWAPGRTAVDQIEPWDEALTEFGAMPSAARAILVEFGGLSVGERGPGIDHARGTIDFDPTMAVGESDRFDG